MTGLTMERPLYIEVVATNQEDAVNQHRGSVYKVTYSGQPRKGGRVYRLFLTEADWERYQRTKDDT